MIRNASNYALNAINGTVPDTSGALKDYFQPMIFTRVIKETVGFQVVETPRSLNFQGVIQPFSSRQLMLRPEGERAWSWFTLHAETALVLNVDEVVTYQGVQTRVMARQDFTLYGYVLYELVQDWTGAGPR